MEPARVAWILWATSIPGVLLLLRYAREDHLEFPPGHEEHWPLRTAAVTWVLHCTWGPVILFLMGERLSTFIGLNITLYLLAFLRWIRSRDAFLILMVANLVVIGLVPTLGHLLAPYYFPMAR